MDQQQEINNLKQANEELTLRIEQLETAMLNHTHTGQDGSNYLYNESIKLKPGSFFNTGKAALAESSNEDTQVAGLVVGDSADVEGTLNTAKGAQFTIEHQKSTDGSTNQTFIYSYRNPVYIGTSGSVSSGGTTLSQNEFAWTTNELDGAYVIAYDSANPGQFDVFEIASNTSSTITITGGTWTFTDSSGAWTVFVPVYLGSADYPYRRLYTMNGTAGGVRFGPGDTAGGQNGLLYMDSAGDIYWRNKSGTSTKLN